MCGAWAPDGGPGPSSVGTVGVSRKPRCRNGRNQRLVLINPKGERHAPSPQRSGARNRPGATGHGRPENGSHLPTFTVMGTLTPPGEVFRGHTGLMWGRGTQSCLPHPCLVLQPQNPGHRLGQIPVWLKEQRLLLAFAKACGLTPGELGASGRLPRRDGGAPAGLEGAQEEQKGISVSRSVEGLLRDETYCLLLGGCRAPPLLSILAPAPGPQLPQAGRSASPGLC